MDQIVVGNNNQISKIMKEAEQKKNKREVYRRVKRRESFAGWPLLDKDNKSSSLKSLFSSNTPISKETTGTLHKKRKRFHQSKF